METLDLGVKKFEITRQAFIVFIALVVSFFAQLIILIFFVEENDIAQYVFFIIYIAIMIPLIVYVNNCFVTGKCVVLSWVAAIIYVLTAVVWVGIMISLILSNNGKKKSSSSKKSSR